MTLAFVLFLIAGEAFCIYRLARKLKDTRDRVRNLEQALDEHRPIQLTDNDVEAILRLMADHEADPPQAFKDAAAEYLKSYGGTV